MVTFAVLLPWLVVAAIVIGYPLVTGRIRVGGPGATPITRDDDPEAFWKAYALSTGLFIVISAVLAVVVLPRLPS